MAERKAVFLDKDGTLIPDVPYNVNPDLISLANGVMEGLKLLKEAGYIFIVISNQAGVARGYFQINELEKVKQKIDLLLNQEGIEIEKYLVGVLHVGELRENNWWKENKTSLVLATEPIIEDFEVIKLKKRSLELAGIV